MAVIGLDGTSILVSGKGVSRHQCGLLKSLSKLDKKNRYYVFLNKKYILPPLPKQDNFHYVRVYIPNRLSWEQFLLPMIARKYKLNIYHSISDTLPLIGNMKFVLTVTEIPNYRIELAQRIGHNSLYAKLSHRYNRFIFSPSLKKARVIIINSQSTKSDLVRRYNVDEEKLRVLYLAADEQFYPDDYEDNLIDTRKKHNAETGYILHISSADPRDNTRAVIYAYHMALPQLKIPKKLIVVGNIDHKQTGLDRLITELNLKDDIIFTGYFSEIKELVALYQAADLYIDPSLYEGFGLQVVEAMACGIPIITSNATSLPEVVGDAGILVAPTDIDGLASGITSVLTNPGLRQSMCKKSFERAKFFSWDKLGAQTLKIYNTLAG